MRELALSPRIVGFAVLLGLLGGHLGLQTTEFFPVDDAYISFRYAANLARGEGPVFNVGERVEGYSNFLFVVLLAAGSKLGVTPPLAARLVNVTGVAFLAWVLACGRRSGGVPADLPSGEEATAPRWSNAGIGWMAGLVLVLSPHTFLNLLSGLEAPATAALLTAGVVYLGRDRPCPAAFCFLLVALNRPEGIVLALLAAGYDIWRGRRQIGTRLRGWLLWLIAPYSLFFIWRVAYYGSLLPNSVRAKSGLVASSQLDRSLTYMGRALEVYWPLMVLALLGLIVGRQLSAMLRGAWVILLGVTGLCLVTGSGDPYVTLMRYLYPGLPLLLMIASASARIVMRRAYAAGRRPWDVALGVGAAVLLVAQLALVVYGSSFELLRREKFEGLTRIGVREKIASGLAQILAQDRAPHTSERLRIPIGQHDLARWLIEHAEADAALVSSQVGIAPYYTGLRVIDTFGLVTRHIAELPGPPGAKKDPDFVFGQEPEFFVFRKPRKLLGGIPADAQLFRDPRLRRRYDLVRMFSLGGPRLLLFQRRDRATFDVRYDFAQQFSPRLVGRLVEGAWQSGDGAPRGPAIRRSQTQFLNKKKRRKLRRALEPAVRGVGADFQAAGAMRGWQKQWRSWIEHRPGAATTAIRYRVRMPEEAVLRFGLGAPPRKRPGRDRRVGSAVRYSILVDDGATEGRSQEVFSSIQDPGSKPAHRSPRHFEIDLSSYAGREVTIYFQAERLAERPERSGWIEPLLVRHPDTGDRRVVPGAGASEPGPTLAAAEAE